MSTTNHPLSNINRRHLLKSLGIAAFATVSVPAVAFEKNAAPKLKNVTLKYAATVPDLIEDKGWKENDVVRTTGYHKTSDGGHAEYIIQKTANVEDGSIALKNGLFASLINVSAVNYQMFGAISDGQNDDGVQLKAAHEFANKYNLPVVNPIGEYWIKNTHSIKIINNVDWGNSIFHIDEKYNNPKASRFEVSSKVKEKAITLSADEKASFLKKLKPGVSLISELAPYNNCMVIVADAKDKIGFRSGARFVGQAWSREDFFYVEEHGRIIGDLAWEFKDYSSLVAVPVSDTYLIINGGGFYLSGDSHGKGYTRNGFSITRSRTYIQNQFVGLEPGKIDSAPNARSGFYSFNKVYDVMLENVRLIPYEQDREGTANDVPAGTYGISAGRMLNGTFRNVTAEGGLVHWGVFGTNLNKNFKIDNSKLNRVDVHFHCWNLHIKDSLIGQRGISITGGGNLVIENTRCESSSFVNFRRDFGSRWDGDITIRNCIFKPSSLRENSVLNFNPEDFDYKYPVALGRSISIDQMVIDYTGNPNKAASWLMFFPSFSRLKHGDRLSFPAIINIRNVNVVGRTAGLRLFKLSDAQHLNLGQKGAYDGVQLQANAKFIFDNIQLENLADTGLATDKDVHIQFNQRDKSSGADEFSLYSDIKFVDCKGIAADFSNHIGNVNFYNCSVTKIIGKKDSEMPGKLAFTACTFEPTAKAPEHIALAVASELGTSFTNCTLHSPKINGVYQPERLDRITFVQVNKSVKYNHLNTLLGRDILNYYKRKGIALNPKFITMLKSHHELESSTVA